MNIKQLIGSGDKIMKFTLPFAIIGIVLNVIYPQWFKINLEKTVFIIGTVLLILGIPFWIISVVQMLKYVPQKKLITRGPYRIILHPIYTSVALLVIPGFSLLFDTWVGLAIGVILYIFSRLFRHMEDSELESIFKEEYKTYRSSVIFPWL